MKKPATNKPKYIILRGEQNTGKSTTIRNFWAVMSQQGRVVMPWQLHSTRRVPTLLKDSKGIVEYKGKLIGFYSWGDAASSFTNPSRRWNAFTRRCDIVICACHPCGSSQAFLLNFFQTNHIDELYWISKFHDTTLVSSVQRTVRHLQALIEVL